VRGIELYALWPPASGAPPGAITALPEIGALRHQIGLWPGTRLVWQPPREDETAHWQPVAAAAPALRALRDHAQALASSAGAAPAYYVYHLDTLRAHVDRGLVRQVRHRQRLARQRGEAVRGSPAMWATEAALTTLLRQVGITSTLSASVSAAVERGPHASIAEPWAPVYFSHFDRATGRRGWIIVAPNAALVAGISAGEVETLASLIQPRDTGDAGILPDRYEAVLARIVEWNGAQDVFDAVSQLEALVEGGRRSTDGQLWLNFALAAIGVLLTLYAAPRLGRGQIIPLALLAGASTLFALYARSGRPAYQVAGWLAFAAALAVGVALVT